MAAVTSFSQNSARPGPARSYQSGASLTRVDAQTSHRDNFPNGMAILRVPIRRCGFSKQGHCLYPTLIVSICHWCNSWVFCRGIVSFVFRLDMMFFLFSVIYCNNLNTSISCWPAQSAVSQLPPLPSSSDRPAIAACRAHPRSLPHCNSLHSSACSSLFAHPLVPFRLPPFVLQ